MLEPELTCSDTGYQATRDRRRRENQISGLSVLIEKISPETPTFVRISVYSQVGLSDPKGRSPEPPSFR